MKGNDDKKSEKEAKPLVNKIKKSLAEQIKDVKASTRLTDSPSCIVMDNNDPSVQMQEMMKAMGQGSQMGEIKPILEVNPKHPIVKEMAKMRKGKSFDNLCQLLLDQAKLVEGLKLQNPSEFVNRVNSLLEKSF